MQQNKPSSAELRYLILAYNKFYDIFEDAFGESFWRRSKYYRFSKIKDAFSIYSELLNYEPLDDVIAYLRTHRPPMEAEIGGELFKTIRNILAHFPVFESWNNVYLDSELINWHKPGQTIDKFFTKYEGHGPVKYRFWRADTKNMTYLSINFPSTYSKGDRVWLKDIMTEREGVTFSLILMRQILNTQVEEIDGKSAH